jgi:ABC-type nitrate/sulfonate/bicarbonate transport system substrate-binding protein
VQVPYGYTPVVAARAAAVSSPHEKVVLRRFLEASAAGWDAVVKEPAEAARDVRPFPLLSACNQPRNC